MCFSANASFGAAAILGTVGFLTMNRVKEPSQKIFAMIPLFFSIQQVSEGMVWLSLSMQGFTVWEHPSVTFFLLFAQVIWPVWIPLAIFLIEKNPIRKKVLLVFLGFGILLAVYLGICLTIYPVKAEIASYHILYTLDFPAALKWPGNIIYFAVTVFAPLISSRRKVPFLGIAIMVSYIITQLFYSDFVISVWCFFAALISVTVLYIVTELNGESSIVSTKGPMEALP